MEVIPEYPELVIRDIEHMVERDRRDGRPSWDPTWLREELGLEDG